MLFLFHWNHLNSIHIHIHSVEWVDEHLKHRKPIKVQLFVDWVLKIEFKTILKH